MGGWRMVGVFQLSFGLAISQLLRRHRSLDRLDGSAHYLVCLLKGIARVGESSK